MKKFIFTLLFVCFALPTVAEDINMTPQHSFYGYSNNGFKTQMPKLHKPLSATDIVEERSEIMKPKSVKNMGDTTPSQNSPMTYDRFPQNYDSSNMMLMQSVRNNMQNMLIGY